MPSPRSLGLGIPYQKKLPVDVVWFGPRSVGSLDVHPVIWLRRATCNAVAPSDMGAKQEHFPLVPPWHDIDSMLMHKDLTYFLRQAKFWTSQ